MTVLFLVSDMANLRVYYQNTRGLRTKTNIFFRNLLSCDYDVICLTETWLLPGIYDSEIIDDRYIVYRCDRDYSTRSDGMGGGTLIAVRKGVVVSKVTSYSSNNEGSADIISICITLSNNNTLHIYCCYFLQCPNHLDDLLKFYENVSNVILTNPDDQFLITGDFNIRYAFWSCDNMGKFVLKDTSESGNDNLVYAMSNFLSFNDLKQFNFVYNINYRQLDLVISSNHCNVKKSLSPLVKEDNHHPSLEININMTKLKSLTPASRVVSLFRKCDYNAINKAIAKVNWEDAFNGMDVDTAVEHFYSIINNIISDMIPKKTVSNSLSYPIWYSPALIKVINEKLKFHKKWKCYSSRSDYSTFSKLRDRQKRLELACYDTFITQSEINIKKCSKQFWTFVKSKKKTGVLPNHLYLNDNTSSDGHQICNMFNNYFYSAFLSNFPSSTSQTVSNERGCVDISSIDITYDTVKRYLKYLDVNKGTGPDGIPPYFLRKCHKEICRPLYYLFTLSLNSGVMPKVWKRCFVVPIPKGGDKHNIANYRPISKLSVIPKMFERIIYDSLFSIVRPFIIKEQHGFLNKRSTETNLCEFVDNITNSMENGFQVDAVYTDYSKAFDKICHPILVQKLMNFGIHGDLLRWLESYLKNRTQAVTVKGYCSTFLPVPSGVPQGSHLGPLLFNIFINDINQIFKTSQFILYADDTKIYKEIRSVEDCLSLQEDLNNLSAYCQDNFLFLNSNKCKVITFSRKRNNIVFPYHINGNKLEKVSVIKDLGVLLDSKLMFDIHICATTEKAYRMLGFVLRVSRDFRHISTVLLLYNCFVRTILEYASVVWNPHYQVYVEKLEWIQNKFYKQLIYRANCGNVSDLPKLLSLEKRRTVRDQIFLFKIINNYIDSSYLLNLISFRCPRVPSRSKNVFSPSIARTNYGSNTFIRRTCNTHNRDFSDVDIFHLKLIKFKSSLLDILEI